jgi:hypothetical protein
MMMDLRNGWWQILSPKMATTLAATVAVRAVVGLCSRRHHHQYRLLVG